MSLWKDSKGKYMKETLYIYMHANYQMQSLLTRPASTPSSPMEQDDGPQAIVLHPILSFLIDTTGCMGKHNIVLHIYFCRLTLFCVFLSSCVQVSSDRLLLDIYSLVSLRQRCSSCSIAASVTWWHLYICNSRS